MKYLDDIALQTAEFLLQIKAIKLNNDHPFTWASGRKSPIYCDNRVTLSYPEIRTHIRQNFVHLINELYSEVDVIAGVATGGIAHGVLAAQDLGKPFVYVRPSEKQHGMGNRIEGIVKDGQSVILVEDLISTGKSSLSAVEALRQEGCVVKGMVAIFTYGLDVAKEAFSQADVALLTMTNYDALIQKAVTENYIREADLVSLEKWRENPEAWSEKHS